MLQIIYVNMKNMKFVTSYKKHLNTLEKSTEEVKRELDLIIEKKYNDIIKSIRQYNRITKSESIDLLHDTYLKILDVKPNIITIGYILISVRNNLQQSRKKKEEVLEVDIPIEDNGMMELLKAQDNLYGLIMQQINSSNFTQIEEIILKSRIYSNYSFDTISTVVNQPKTKVQRTQQTAIKKLRKILDDRWNFNSNNDSYWNQLDSGFTEGNIK